MPHTVAELVLLAILNLVVGSFVGWYCTWVYYKTKETK